MERTRVIRRRSIRRFASYSVVVALISTAFLTLSTNALGGTQLTRPNIILILSDDQSYESIDKMPYLRSRIPPQAGWYRFDNPFAEPNHAG